MRTFVVGASLLLLGSSAVRAEGQLPQAPLPQAMEEQQEWAARPHVKRPSDMTGMTGMAGMGSMAVGDPGACSRTEFFDVNEGMCLPLPQPEMEGMEMNPPFLMLHGNGFLVGTTENGPRGRDAFAAPSMTMFDFGRTVGGAHFLEASLMLTVDKWVFPDRGYPELLQIGETDAQGRPFVDAQHPHSSPIMGLTLSDTFRVGSGHLKLFFSPRGPTTDGPIVFMHRPTGMVNPDAPLGHHIGQDVGHITSTVLGASLGWGSEQFEVSAFHGTEPEPEKVDLPQGAPNSFSARYAHSFSRELFAMASVAYVKDPEPDQSSTVLRYSASGYLNRPLGESWKLSDALIYGGITNYDNARFLSSFSEELAVGPSEPSLTTFGQLWSRIELLQRTPNELEVSAPDPDRGRWVAALTAGYTHSLARFGGAQLGAGISATKDLLPGELIGAYGGNPWTGRAFLRLNGMTMF